MSSEAIRLYKKGYRVPKGDYYSYDETENIALISKALTRRAFLRSSAFYLLILSGIIGLALIIIFFSPSTKPSAHRWLGVCNNTSDICNRITGSSNKVSG